MNDSRDHRAVVIDAIADIMEIEAGTIDGAALLREDLGMDSLASLELLSSLSRELSVDLEMEDAMEIATVDDACRFVERHLAAHA